MTRPNTPTLVTCSWFAAVWGPEGEEPETYTHCDQVPTAYVVTGTGTGELLCREHAIAARLDAELEHLPHRFYSPVLPQTLETLAACAAIQRLADSIDGGWSLSRAEIKNLAWSVVTMIQEDLRDVTRVDI